MGALQDILAAAIRADLPPEPRLLVAVSGGPDSQALLHLLAHLDAPPTLWAVGVDHGLRPAAAAELAEAEGLAQRLQVPFHRLSVQLPTRGNRLAAARRARYGALRRLAQALGANAVALGHHADDQLETLLLHLCRGQGGRPLLGMRRRRGLWWRPLLSCPGQALRTYLRQHQVPWADDPSNHHPARARAQLRRQVLPCLQALNPAVSQHADAFAQATQDDEAALQHWARRALQRCLRPQGALDAQALGRLPGAVGRRVLRLWLHRSGIEAPGPRWLAQLWAARCLPQGRWHQGPGWVQLERGSFRCGLGQRAAPMPERAVEAPCCLPLYDTGGPNLVAHTRPATGADVPRSRAGVAFDANHLHFNLWLRSWQPGDRFTPWGLHGHRQVGDFFTDLKMPTALRDQWPILMHGDEVAWVVGLRRASLAALGPGTQRVVALEVQGDLPWSPC